MKLKWAALFVICLLSESSLLAQAPALASGSRTLPGQLAPPAISAGFSSPGAASENPFLGSRPAGTVQAKPFSLSLAKAIRLGLKNNLGTILGNEQRRLALGAHWQARSFLLPNLSGAISEELTQINLEAFGFSGFPGVPSIVGPFSVADARMYLRQPIFDLQAIRNSRASSENLKAAGFSYKNARETVVLVVTNLYLQTIAAAGRVDAVQAQVTTAKALYGQAVAFKKAGTAPAIVVLRAQVELKAGQQLLIQARNVLEKQKLNLARAVGLPAGQQVRLTSRISYTPPPKLTIQQALERAYRLRPDYQGAIALVRSAEEARKAVSAERFPSLAFQGDYGAIGRAPGRSHGSFTVAASLNIPIFQGGRIHGEALQARARLEQQKAKLADLRGRIGYEIRTAMLDLSAANEQVAVAHAARKLARREMTQAQDRFAAGVTDNVEVVQAQQALATADENYISSLYSYNSAKIVLAKALGVAEAKFQDFLAMGKQ